MKKLIFAALLVAVRVQAADYSDDDLCRAIGETRVTALQPRDRLFMEQKCICFPRDLGCAAKGSDKAKSLAKLAADLDVKEAADRAAAAKRDQDAQAEAVKRFKAGRAATAKLRAAYWACANDPASPGCVAQADALEAACEKHGIRFGSISVTDPCYKP